ncbi:MAG TPA: hypothetical protein VER33_19640 [Polyangiaceae bacterium]|nr:hypothetical protein [Polyangiaceae bacterium]
MPPDRDACGPALLLVTAAPGGHEQAERDRAVFSFIGLKSEVAFRSG